MTARVPSLDWVALGPVTVTVVGALAVLLVDALRPRRFARLHDVVALVSLTLAGAAVTGLAFGGGERSTACVPGQGVDLPGCSFVVSDVTVALQAIVVVGALGCLLLAMDGPGARDRTAHHLLLLTATAGALAVAGARDLATLAVALRPPRCPRSAWSRCAGTLRAPRRR